jgi:hypothetical protein
MRGIYATLTLPLLSLLAAHAAAKVPPRAGRWLPVALSGLLVALALGTAWQGGPPTILQPACTADTQAVATAIRSTGIRHLALPSGHSATLVGFYLSDAVVPERAAETSPSASEYGEYRIHNLVTPGELSTEWRATAEHALERLVGTHGDLLLLDVQHVEPTWPELEAAGGCEVREEFEGVRLLRCAGDDAAPVNTSRLRPSTASTNQ